MKRNNKKGFTIVELVIVIAVIAILSAVLIPTFGSVIADANATAAMQEARNAYTGFLSDAKKVTALGTTSLYVVGEDGTTYYGETADGFGTTTLPESGTYVVIDVDGAVQTCKNTNCESTDGNCVICGK